MVQFNKRGGQGMNRENMERIEIEELKRENAELIEELIHIREVID